MSTFILVHGAFHGAWAYYQVKTNLENMGHTVIAVDLPSLGKDRSDSSTTTFTDHVNYVSNVVNTQIGKVYLVGHSYGGMVISQVAENLSTKIEKVVFISAFMPMNNEFLFMLAGQDTTSMVNPYTTIVGDNGTTIIMKDEFITTAFYESTSDEEVCLAKSLLVKQPLQTFLAPVVLTSNYESLSKVYISCLDDKAITPAFQKIMYKKHTNVDVYKIETDHSPFLSTPKILSRILNKITC